MTGRRWNEFAQDDSAQDLVEYSVLLGVLALAIVALLTSSSDSIKAIWGVANTALANASTFAAS